MNSLPSQQRGVVLLVSLILLLMLTTLALMATSRSTMQERMAANSQDSNLAFQAAEAGRTAVLADIDRIRLVSPGSELSVAATNIDNMRYCAQMTLGPLVLLNRNGRVYSASLGVGRGTLETRAVLTRSQGTYSADSACTTALASHESGFAIPVFK
jgi:Tfp pilus assembly protein PilX